MTRHSLAVALASVLACPVALAAQDADYVRSLERAQQQRPSAPATKARIADAAEPGTPLVIDGRVLDTDGRTPVTGAIVFAYHTDREGLYDRAGSPPHSWRIRGWASTGPDGRFGFETIRPGAYPGGQARPHVHFTVFLPGGARYHAGELEFESAHPPPGTGPERAAITLRLEARHRF
jgi:protocatechuate 3,4-dioxygenase beta subunit